MAKRNKVAAAVAETVSITSARDLAVQTGGLRLRGIALGKAALQFWPELAQDFAKGHEKWAEYDQGSRSLYDTTHVAPILVRDEKGRYTLTDATDSPDAQHVTACYLNSLTSADWAKCKNDSPTRWTQLDSVREKVNNFIRDNRRTLRDNVKKAMGAKGRKARHGNRTFNEFIVETCQSVEDKMKLEQTRKSIDQSLVDRLTAWINDGKKIISG